MIKNKKKILVAIDDPQTCKAAIEQAEIFLGDSNSTIHVIQVIDEVSGHISSIFKRNHNIDISSLMKQECNERFDEVIKELGLDRNRFNYQITSGISYLEIIRCVIELNIDLLFLNATSQTGAEKRIFGSNTMKLLRKCPCTLWVVDSAVSATHTNEIMVAIDDKLDQSDVLNLITKSLETAITLAEKLKARLHIFQTWRHFGGDVLRHHMASEEVDKMELEMYQEHSESLNDFIQKFDMESIEYEVHLLKGDAGQKIINIMSQKSIDLLVMGTVCRTGIKGLLMGNTAERILKKVCTNVVALKPDGFRFDL